MTSNSNKSGYVQIDIMFAGILFFTFFTVIYIFYQNYFENSHTNSELILLKSTSRDLCTFFRNDLTTNDELDLTILSGYVNSNYVSIKDSLNIDNFNFNLKITNILTSTQVHNFGFESSYSSLSQSYSCYQSGTNILYQIYVEVWK
ncbi:MAG: hypothetical protein HRU03_03050 [Nanoarchaeales archaeon]|nr:hypothetical protein [Nanoarchaeales archaeon]